MFYQDNQQLGELIKSQDVFVRDVISKLYLSLVHRFRPRRNQISGPCCTMNARHNFQDDPND